MALSDDEYEFLQFLEQYWFEYNLIPSADRAVELGIPTPLYTNCFKSSEFRKECLERGISLKGLASVGDGTKAEWQNYMLTEEQIMVANTLLDQVDSRSEKKKLADMGVSTAKYQGFLKDPGYQNYIRARAENALGEHQHVAHYALIDRVKAGDISAIKYFNELTGRYVQASDSKGLDVTMVLMRVLEIIQRHVRDSALQEVIAQEFLSLSDPTAPKIITATLVPQTANAAVPAPAQPKVQKGFFDDGI